MDTQPAPSTHPRLWFALALLLGIAVGIAGTAIAIRFARGSHKSSNALRRVCQNGYCLSLPASWRYRDASYPSDHSTYFYWNPDNALEQLTIVSSGCIGCVTKNNDGVTPDPSGEVPSSVVAQHEVSAYETRYTAYEGRSPYATEGFVFLPHNDKGISGSVIFALDLPNTEHAEAERILNSFALN
jgi:hypothetical protein